MNCVCGHRLGSHGDRAVWPACEADRGDAPLHRYVEEMLLIDVPRFRPETACPCEGFQGE